MENYKAPPDPEEETWGAQSDSEETHGAPLDPEETQEAPSDPEKGTQEAPPDPVAETQEAPSNLVEETKDEAGPAEGSTDLGKAFIPARLKLAISRNLSPNNTITHAE